MNRETTTIQGLLVRPGIDLQMELVETTQAGFLATAYELIGCRAVDYVTSPEGIDVWCDDEGLLVAEPELNLGASGLVGRAIYGTVILARSDDEGETVSLTDEELEFFDANVLNRQDPR